MASDVVLVASFVESLLVSVAALAVLAALVGGRGCWLRAETPSHPTVFGHWTHWHRFHSLPFSKMDAGWFGT